MKKNHLIKRGDIYYASLDPCEGSEQKGIRPVVILQNNVGNKCSPTTLIAPLSTKKCLNLPTHILIDNVDKIKPNSIIMLEQIRVIDKSRLLSYINKLSKEQMEQIDNSILISFQIKNSSSFDKTNIDFKRRTNKWKKKM